MIIVDINESIRKSQAREIFLRNIWKHTKDSWDIKDKIPNYEELININN